MQIRYFQIITKEPHKYCLDKAIMKSIQKSILAIVLHKQTIFGGTLWIITFYDRILTVLGMKLNFDPNLIVRCP